MTTSEIEILPKTELQEDWYTHSTLNTSSSGGALAINLDGSGRLVVSFINGTSVFSAYRNLDVDGNSDRTWTVEDTHLGLPSFITPKFLDSILSPSKATFLALIGSDNNVYILDCSSRFPRWQRRENKQGIIPVKISLFITKKNELRIAVFTSAGTIYILNPAPFTNIWFEDKAIASMTSSVYDYKVGAAFTETGNLDNSTWGYVVCGGLWGSNMEDGVGVLAADQTLPTLQTIYKGKYYSLTYAVRGGRMPRTTPLIFGIDGSKKATYFKADEHGKYSTFFPFGSDLNFTSLDSIYRTGPDQEKNTVEWIDLYGLDTSGNLWHTRSKAINGSRFTATKTMPNGNIVVPEWETASIISLSAVKSFDVAKETSGTGHAYVVTELPSSSSTSTTLEAYVQDISSTSWTANPVAKFDHTVPKILKRNVYYVELTVRKGGVIAPGLAVKITSPEYCIVDVNGVSTSVSSGQFYITKTNARGLIYLTIPASESLACPVLSIWVQGMDTDLTTDVQPTGEIQKRFASISVDVLKKAKDKTDQSLIFKDLTDTQLKDLSEKLRKAVRPFTNSSVASSDATKNHGQRYLHPKASKDVSVTRHVSDPHMGLISHANQELGASFTIRLNSTRQLNSVKDDPPSIISSWGDFWMQVANGVVKIVTMELESTLKAVKAKIICLVDNVKKVWNGVASFVHQVFDVVSQLFKDVKVETVKIFNWLAYIFAWDDIKATAVAFRTIVDEQIVKAEDYLDKTARTQIQTFFGKAKDWLQDNMETAIVESDKIKVGQNDKPTSDPMINVPSSASWLSSKVESAFKSDDPKLDPALTIQTTDLFSTTIQTFINTLTKAGISQDLSVALEKASDIISNLTSRGGLDKLTFKAFADLFKSLVVLLIDLTQTAISTLIDVLVEALKMFKTVLNTPIEIPVISKIFKEVVKLDLTFFNLIAVPMAIPSTVLYKTFMGGAPFPVVTSTTDTTALANDIGSMADPEPHKKDAAMCWSMIFTILYGNTDILLDFYGIVSEWVDPNRQFDPVMKFLTYSNMFSSWLVMGVGTYSKPTNPRTQFAWEAAVIGTSVTTMIVVFDSANRKFGISTADDKLMDIMGVLIPTIYGFASFSSGIWHMVNIRNGKEEGNPKDKFVVAAELGGALPGMAKIVKFSKNPPAWAPPLAIVDTAGYLIATVAYSIAIDM